MNVKKLPDNLRVTKTFKEKRKKIMKKPVLVVMAAGMGSRYGGLKQIDPVDKEAVNRNYSCRIRKVCEL